MEFFDNMWIQLISFCIPYLSLVFAYLLQKRLARLLIGNARVAYEKLVRDSLVKTFLMFAGSFIVAFLVYATEGNITESITKSLFSLSCLSGLNVLWQNKKNKDTIKEAKSLSISGERANRLNMIEDAHNKAASYYAKVSIGWGALGIVYTWFLYSQFPLNFIWLIALMSTLPAIIASRWADSVTYAATKFANDKELCA